MGRRILLQPPSSEDVSPDPGERQALQGMLGHIGRAKSQMLPSGIVVVDDRNFDAVSEGMPIEEGQWIRVIEVRANRLIVEGIPEPKTAASGEDPLAQPVDWESLPGDPSDRPPA
jgi:membrane-bound serine protease (ClpP class)